eukprot:scaffold308628_cov30-Tisochrysis_lutea.AAC.1
MNAHGVVSLTDAGHTQVDMRSGAKCMHLADLIRCVHLHERLDAHDGAGIKEEREVRHARPDDQKHGVCSERCGASDL